MTGLEFGGQTCYFRGMRFPAPCRAQRTISKGVGLLLLAAATGSCTDRERLLFPTDTDHRGPAVFVDQPATGDTTVSAGPSVPVSGKAIDPDGVDTLYVEVVGGNENFPPFPIQRDTARFGIRINTSGLAGRTMFVLIFGTDRLGNRGDTATTRVSVTP